MDSSAAAASVGTPLHANSQPGSYNSVDEQSPSFDIFENLAREEKKQPASSGKPNQGQSPFGKSLTDSPSTTPKEQAPADSQKQSAAAIQKIQLGELGEFSTDDLTKIVGDLSNLKRGAYDKFQEAARIRQEAQAERGMLKELSEAAKTDPRYVAQLLQKLNIDPRKFAEYQLTTDFEERSLSPEEREFRKFKQDRETFEQERLSFKQEREKEAFEQETSQHEQQFVQNFTQALQNSGIPADVSTVAKMADLYMRKVADGVPGVTLEHVGQLAFHEIKQQHRRIQSGLDDKGFAEYLGPKGLERAAKILADRAQKKQSNFFNQPKTSATPAPSGMPKPDNVNGFYGMREVEALRRKGII